MTFAYFSADGTMCSSRSAEAPEFFFHHSFIDKIWADYQKKGIKNKSAYFNTIKRKMVGVNYYPRDLLDNSRLPGGIRVLFQEPTTHSARKIRAFLASKFDFFLYTCSCVKPFSKSNLISLITLSMFGPRPTAWYWNTLIICLAGAFL